MEEQVCRRCNEKLPLTVFHKDKYRPTGYRNICTPCRNASGEWRRKIAVRKARRDDVKATLACVVCGENEPVCMDFHHLDPTKKEFNISYMFSRGLSLESVLKEIEKCVVLCSNCHRKYHAGVLAHDTLPPIEEFNELKKLGRIESEEEYMHPQLSLW